MLSRDALNGGTATGLPRRVHCVGVGGGGVSALARLLAGCGHVVSGSDRGAARADLAAAGVETWRGSDPGRATGAGLVVRSAAVPDADPEVAAARAAGVPVVKYAQALGRLMARRRGVAVAGTHGKTTTTALLAYILRACGRDPGWLVGGSPRNLPSAGWGAGSDFVAEACEFDHSFLELPYEVAVLTGVAADHLDCFGDLAGVEAAFRRFVGRIPARGVLVQGPGVPTGLDLAVPAGVTRHVVAQELRFGAVQATAQGWAGRLEAGGRWLPFRCLLWGRHNLENAACALVAARALGIPWEVGVDALAGFQGVARRLQVLSEGSAAGAGALIVDDFAHHPEALEAAAAALVVHLPGRRRVALFQPHQVSRTEDFLDGFARALQAFDVVGLCDIFAARDAHPERAETVVAALAVRGGAHVVRIGPAAAADERARALLRAGDACAVMGAGDIDGLAQRLAGTPAGP